jgi:hypothetical protein
MPQGIANRVYRSFPRFQQLNWAVSWLGRESYRIAGATEETKRHIDIYQREHNQTRRRLVHRTEPITAIQGDASFT